MDEREMLVASSEKDRLGEMYLILVLDTSFLFDSEESFLTQLGFVANSIGKIKIIIPWKVLKELEHKSHLSKNGCSANLKKLCNHLFKLINGANSCFMDND